MLRGDLKYWAEDLGLPSHSSDIPCALCPANSSTLPWWELSEHAQWIGHLHSTASFEARFPERHPIFTLVTHFAMSVDVMHVKHMGTDQYFAGSVMYLPTHDVMHGSPEENMKQLRTEILYEYRSGNYGTTYSDMRISMFKKKKKEPIRLRGKAQEVKCFIPLLQKLWDRHADHGYIKHQTIAAGLELSSRIDRVLDRNKNVNILQDGDADVYSQAIWDFLVVQNACAAHYQSYGHKLFDITVKSHYLGHSAIQAQHQNPRCGRCYAGEDMMAKSKKLLSSCVVGNTPFTAGAKCAEKYLAGLHFMATPPSEWI
eukprot:8620896-Pyramimonas_sp.AAC.1